MVLLSVFNLRLKQNQSLNYWLGSTANRLDPFQNRKRLNPLSDDAFILTLNIILILIIFK